MQGSAGEFLRVLESAEECREVLESVMECWRVLVERAKE